MEISEAGIELIKTEEGLRLTAYPDICGNKTIGYGHLVKPGDTFGNTITELQADTLLLADISDAEYIVDREVVVPLDQGEYDALTDFCFNLGDRLGGSTLLRCLNSGDHAGAEEQLVLWINAGGRPNKGLKARRILEMGLWSQGAAG